MLAGLALRFSLDFVLEKTTSSCPASQELLQRPKTGINQAGLNPQNPHTTWRPYAGTLRQAGNVQIWVQRYRSLAWSSGRNFRCSQAMEFGTAVQHRTLTTMLRSTSGKVEPMGPSYHVEDICRFSGVGWRCPELGLRT